MNQSITVQAFWDTENGDTLGFFSLGHHPLTDFLFSVQKEFGEDYDLNQDETYHRYWAKDPAEDGAIGEWEIREVKANDPDSFPVTVTYLET